MEGCSVTRRKEERVKGKVGNIGIVCVVRSDVSDEKKERERV